MAPCRNILDVAMEYRNRFSWCIVPVRGKKASCKWGRFREQRPTEAMLRKLFDRDGITGLAVITGPVSGGLAIRDFDDVAVFDAWLETHPKLAAELPIAKTKRGGHIYFCGPQGFVELPDGEYRGDSAHYAVAPPSTHPEGGRYAWLHPPAVRIPEVEPVSAGLLPGTHAMGLCVCVSQRACVSHKVGTCVSHGDAVEQAIRRTLPDGPGQRNRRVFRLALELQKIRYPDVSEALRGVVVEWHLRALPFIRTKEPEESLTDFFIAWERIKASVRWEIEHAVQAALSGPIPKEADRYQPPALRNLVALCAALQDHAEDKPFYLSCRMVEELLGVGRMIAWRMLQLLSADRVLIEVRRGTQGIGGRATEWRFANRPAVPMSRTAIREPEA